jgi:hypothetical protein
LNAVTHPAILLARPQPRPDLVKDGAHFQKIGLRIEEKIQRVTLNRPSFDLV